MTGEDCYLSTDNENIAQRDRSGDQIKTFRHEKLSEKLFVLRCQDFERYIKLWTDDWLDKIVEDTVMVQEANEEEKKGTKSLCSSKNSI